MFLHNKTKKEKKALFEYQCIQHESPNRGNYFYDPVVDRTAI